MGKLMSPGFEAGLSDDLPLFSTFSAGLGVLVASWFGPSDETWSGLNFGGDTAGDPLESLRSPLSPGDLDSDLRLLE